jgi:hypothetical protein
VGGNATVGGSLTVTGSIAASSLGVSVGGLLLRPQGGTSAQRNAHFGTPTTDATKAALANAAVRWYNSDNDRWETYYAVTGTAGLAVPGLRTGMASGWYSVPESDWAGKSGPSGYVAAYKASWARNYISQGSTLNVGSNVNIQIGIEGFYECHAFLRGGASGNGAYIGLGLDGDRAAFELRSNPTAGSMEGIWTHDHPAATNNFSVSHYWGKLYAGDLITAGPYTSGTDIGLGSAASSGALVVLRRA